jgi:hypothetical protein
LQEGCKFLCAGLPAIAFGCFGVGFGSEVELYEPPEGSGGEFLVFAVEGDVEVQFQPKKPGDATVSYGVFGVVVYGVLMVVGDQQFIDGAVGLLINSHVVVHQYLVLEHVDDDLFDAIGIQHLVYDLL